MTTFTQARDKQFTPEEQRLMDKLMDVLQENNVVPETGERLLLWAAGASIGLRGDQLFCPHVLGNLLDGWQVAMTYSMEPRQ